MQFLPLILAGLQALDPQLVLVDPIKTGVVLMRFFKVSEQWQFGKQSLICYSLYENTSYKHFRTEAMLSGARVGSVTLVRGRDDLALPLLQYNKK